MSFADAFAGRRVFLTGHTGFKGSWLALWLARLGARVTGYSLAPNTEPSNFTACRLQELLERHHLHDIRDSERLARAVADCDPEIVFHLAAQPLVRLGYAEPRETFEINVMGTASVLEALRRLDKPCPAVMVSSDKCYRNTEQVWGYRENDELGGSDPYSASKGAAELVIRSYRQSFGLKLASVRAGNVIGGGDWSLDRIIPDCVRALAAGERVKVRNPRSIRPWQHVLEPLSGYLTVAARLLGGDPGGDWNFGPASGGEVPVGELVDLFCQGWGGGRWDDVSDPAAPHEAAVLRVCSDKAIGLLGWRPRWDVRQAVERSAHWFRRFQAGDDARELCLAEIAAYSIAL